MCFPGRPFRKAGCPPFVVACRGRGAAGSCDALSAPVLTLLLLGVQGGEPDLKENMVLILASTDKPGSLSIQVSFEVWVWNWWD